jgi:hypothetical protein
VLLSFVPAKTGMPLVAGIIAWFVTASVVIVLPFHPIGARAAALIAGLFPAVPFFVETTRLAFGLMECFGMLPFAAAAVLVTIPPLPTVRARLAYLFTWCGTREVNRRKRAFDVKIFQQLMIATAVAALSMAAVKMATASGILPLRWLAGGILIFAFAEMATAGPAFVAAAMGMTVPQWFGSPYRSTSINDFWTRRWNILTSQMILRPNCYEPLARRSVALAVAVTFVLSGVFHALFAYVLLGKWGIAWLCGAFFFVQPLLIAIERWMKVRRWRPAAARAWTLTALTITSPLFTEPALRAAENSWEAADSVILPTLILLAGVMIASTINALGSLAARPKRLVVAGTVPA